MTANQHSFFSAAIQAQWGAEFDGELIGVLSHLEDAEAFASMDFEALEPFIQAGQLDRENWSRQAALADLQAARDEFWRVKERIGAEHPGENVFQIIAKHAARLAEWRVSRNPRDIEVAIIIGMADWLTVSGAVPSAKVVESLISAMKGIGRIFDPSLSSDEKERIEKSELMRSITAAVELCADRRTPATRGEFKKRLFGHIGGCARLIRDMGLFPANDIRIDRWVRRYSLPLVAENKRSSVFDGILYAGKVTRR